MIIARFNDKNVEKVVNTIIVILFIVFLIWSSASKSAPNLAPQANVLNLLLICGLFAVAWVVHEIIHFVALWKFSKLQPRFGFSYVILQPDVPISRKQAVIGYLLPVTVIWIVFVVAALFIKPILIIVAVLHTPLCYIDVVDAIRVCKVRGNNLRVRHENTRSGIETTISDS